MGDTDHLVARGWAGLVLGCTPSASSDSLLTLPLLALYDGRRGKWRMKYFFYGYYPLHLAVIYGVGLVL